MANRLVDHVWVVDTAGTDAVVLETVYVTGIYWDGPSTAGHQAVLKNVDNDDTVWSATAWGTDPQDVPMTTPFRCAGGFKVTTLTSGTLYIYGRLE